MNIQFKPKNTAAAAPQPLPTAALALDRGFSLGGQRPYGSCFPAAIYSAYHSSRVRVTSDAWAMSMTLC